MYQRRKKRERRGIIKIDGFIFLYSTLSSLPSLLSLSPLVSCFASISFSSPAPPCSYFVLVNI
jgi:hypothetical protein